MNTYLTKAILLNKKISLMTRLIVAGRKITKVFQPEYNRYSFSDSDTETETEPEIDTCTDIYDYNCNCDCNYTQPNELCLFFVASIVSMAFYLSVISFLY